MTTHDNLRGVILVGGRSTRMGKDKFTLKYNGETLLVKAYDLLKNSGLDTYVSCSALQEPLLKDRFNVIVDNIDDEGPLSGILSALTHLRKPVLILAIDYPLLRQQTILSLIESRDALKQATLYYLPDSKEWPCLCSILEMSAINDLKKYFDNGGRSVRRFLETLDFESVDFNKKEFFNLNSREEYKKLLSGQYFSS